MNRNEILFFIMDFFLLVALFELENIFNKVLLLRLNQISTLVNLEIS